MAQSAKNSESWPLRYFQNWFHAQKSNMFSIKWLLLCTNCRLWNTGWNCAFPKSLKFESIPRSVRCESGKQIARRCKFSDIVKHGGITQGPTSNSHVLLIVCNAICSPSINIVLNFGKDPSIRVIEVHLVSPFFNFQLWRETLQFLSLQLTTPLHHIIHTCITIDFIHANWK